MSLTYSGVFWPSQTGMSSRTGSSTVTSSSARGTFCTSTSWHLSWDCAQYGQRARWSVASFTVSPVRIRARVI